MSQHDQPQTHTSEPAAAAPRQTARKRMFSLLLLVVIAAAAGYGVWWYLQASRYISTDNAYAAVEISEITPAVGGTVQEVKVVDTQTVHQGDVLVVIDDRDTRLALQQTEAELASAVRRVRGYYANDLGLKAQIAARDADEQRAEAQLAAAEADFKRADVDLKRREALKGSGSVSGDELTSAQNAYATAKANLAVARASAEQAKANQQAAQGSREANTVLIDNTTVDAHPEVALARARRDQARLDLERTLVRAPVDGIVAKRQVQVGQRIQAGAQLLSIVPLQKMHVDANFKEDELPEVKVGQSAEVIADLYGDKVVYHGTVAGFSGGTGAAFAAIPAQNATGNWIKVVQRLPVRIELDAADLTAHPLRVGLSMDVTIDTRSTPR